MADVFISYARPNVAIARMVARSLRATGHAVWFDEDLPASRAYADVISEKLDAADAVIVLWTAESSSSQWVRSEANRARENGSLVQLRFDQARLPMPFDQIQCLDFQGWRGDRRSPGYKRLLADIDALAAGDGAEAPPAAAVPVRRPALTRRRVLVGAGAAMAAVAAGLFGWRQLAAPAGSAEAELLLQKAFAVMQDGRPEEQGQALAYVQEATRVAPRFAKGWGVLAVNHALRKFQVPPHARAGEEMRCRSAAKSALDLDGDEPFASCALVLLVPPYRNWDRVERLGRDLARRFPSLPMAIHIFSDALADSGRWREAVEAHEGIDRTRYLIPLSERAIIQALWSAGEVQRAETLLGGAAQRWPQHRAIWNLKINFLTYTGRADEAVRLLENRAAHPPDYPEALLASSLATARAMAGTASRESAVRTNLAMLDGAPPEYLTYLNRKVSAAQLVAERCASLGDADTAFAILDGYYFGRGPWARVQPTAGDEDRSTVILFEPPMRGLRRDPRFVRLVREIGLELSPATSSVLNRHDAGEGSGAVAG